MAEKAEKREMKSPSELEKIIAAKLAEYEACAELRPNHVYWHEPDETGCNWSLHSMRGKAAQVAECLRAINDYAIELRRRYNIPTPER